MSKPAPTPEPAAPETPAPSPSSMKTKLKIGGIVLAIVLAEWAAAYMYLPGSAKTSQAADADEDDAPEHASKDGEGHGHGEKGAHAGAKGEMLSDQSEVDLGQFAVTGFQPVSSSTQYISFHLYGTIDHKYGEEFTRRFEENKHRIRDNVIVIIRSAEVTDLTDAGLGLIKRRILETTNKTLGKPMLKAVIFSEFSFVEQ